MITSLSPALSRVSVDVKPSDLFAKKGSWVQFSSKWQGDVDWAIGKMFVVNNDPVVVTFPVSYVIPGDDYIDINLAVLQTGFAYNVLNLYPGKAQVLYQAGLGIAKGDFLIQFGIPSAQQYVYRLGTSYMYPDLSDTRLRYLGEKTYKDSPLDAPVMFLYFIKNAPYMYLRIYALKGKDYEKCSVSFYINKLSLAEVKPNTGEDAEHYKMRLASMGQTALYVPYYTELTDY